MPASDDEMYDPNDQFQNQTEFNNKQKLLNTILKRINRSKNLVNKGTEVQSDLESLEDSDEDPRGQVIETIINQKSKSIADVLLNDGLNKLYGNFFGQNAHPYARQQQEERAAEPRKAKAEGRKIGGEFQKQPQKDGGRSSSSNQVQRA